MTTTTYQIWESKLNNLGIFAATEKLIEHLDKAPKTTVAAELKTINLVKKVIETNKNGGDLTKIMH
jgi:hypothetical protein